MDRRRRQWVPLHVDVAHGQTAERLREAFGRDGLLVWILYLAACKANPIQGQFSYTSEADGWTKLGLYGDEPDFTLADFFALTGRLKKTRQTRVGRVVNVINTRWEEWNDVIRRDVDASRSARKRAQITRTKDGLSADREREESESEKDHDHEQQQRSDGSSPTTTSAARATAPEPEPPTEEEQDDTAAAAHPAGELAIFTACRRFGADQAVVSPIAEQVSEQTLLETVAKVERKIERGGVEDVPALFVHVLQRAPRLTAPDSAPLAVLTPEQEAEADARTYARQRHPWDVASDLIDRKLRKAGLDDDLRAAVLDRAHATYDDIATEPGAGA